MAGDLTLYWAPTSPFARIVMAAAHELGVADRFRLVEATVENIVDVVSPANPLAQIPTMDLGDGTILYDSAVIVAWLDAQFGGALASPLGGAGDDRWRIAARTAAATGLMDAAVAERHLSLQPEGHRPDGFIERLRGRRARVLTRLGETVAPVDAPVTTDAIAAGCALGYLDFR
ncbi:MAG: glutathione S-transferase N-terminal domain-containing protein, partial [Rhodospirillaceae bacterium]|nr:glutathione S-transferase N-terminal domain-containing protein [Rhodospirillaceae bacterium]